MRKKLSKDQRSRLWGRIYERDKERFNDSWRIRCKSCGVFGSKRTLVVDHVDNDSTNNELSNLQPLCRRCNYLKDPRGSEPREKPQDVGDDDARTAELRKNSKAEPKFRRWVLEYVRKNGPTIKEILINAGAEAAEVSPITAVRYLKKLCSVVGPLMVTYDDEVDQEMVRLRNGRHANDEVELDETERVLP